MAKFKQETMSVTNYLKKSKDVPANEKLGWPEIKDGEFDFDHPLQRRDKQWSPLQRSELIESIIRGYVIPPVYTIDEKCDYGRNQLLKKKVVIDGKQRLTTIRSFMRDEFALHKSIKPVEINGEIYEIAGKKFSELDAEVQEEIDTDILIYSCPVEDITNNEIKEIFRRLNNGKQLTNAQKNSVYLDEDLNKRIFDVLTTSVNYTSIEEYKKAKRRGRPKADADQEQEEEVADVAPEYMTVNNEVSFWGDVAVVGNSAVKNGEDRNLVLQCAMLISNYDYEGGFKDVDIKAYLQEKELDEEDYDSEKNNAIIHEREDVYGKLKTAVETLSMGLLERRGLQKKGKKIIPEQNFKKVSIAPIINGMHLAIERGQADLYINRLVKFFDEYKDNNEYASYVGSGTANADSVIGRMKYFRNMAEMGPSDEEMAEVEKVQADRQAREEQITEVKTQMAEREAEAERLAAEKAKEKRKDKGTGNKPRKNSSKKKKDEVLEGAAEDQKVKAETQEEVAEGQEVKAEVQAEKPAKPKRNRSKKKAKKAEESVAETEEVKTEEEAKAEEEVKTEDKAEEMTSDQSTPEANQEVQAEVQESASEDGEQPAENPEDQAWN